MTNRLNQKKIEMEFNILKEKEGIRVEKKTDLVSVPVLIIAAIISIIGIIYPLILSLFTG